MAALKRREHRADVLPLMALMLLFVTLALLVIAFGARTYQKVLDRQESSYALRASLSYMTGKVRALDSANALMLSQTNEGMPLLSLTEEIDGAFYTTYIYCHDGALCELFTAAGNEFSPESGTALVELAAFEAWLEEGLLFLRAESLQGQKESCSVALRSFQEVTLHD